jgi:hypothetical protein
MTTHDHQADAGLPQDRQFDVQGHREPQGRQVDPQAQQYGQSATADLRRPDVTRQAEGRPAAQYEPSTQTEPESAERQTMTSPGGPDTDMSLFGETELSGFRTRWSDVQAAFVDDPRDSVQKADALVSEVVDQLTRGFTEVRTRMEGQWARGEETSTEDLRIALTRYREFFQRLLAI